MTNVAVQGDINVQSNRVFDNIEAVLAGAGATWKDVVKVNVYMTNLADFAKMNEIYAKRFKAPFPARSTVQVVKLPRDAKIEIEAVAVVRTGSGSDRVQ